MKAIAMHAQKRPAARYLEDTQCARGDLQTPAKALTHPKEPSVCHLVTPARPHTPATAENQHSASYIERRTSKQ